MRLLTTILILATGCVGNVGDGGQGDDDGNNNTDNRTAKEMFKADVHPALLKCSGNACHDNTGTSAALSKFYNADAETSYTATVMTPTLVSTFSALAPILTHVQAGHKGLSYNPDETTKMTNWLAKETTERAGGNGSGSGSNQPPPFDPKAVLAEWSGCMSQANFNTANMTATWSAFAAKNQQKCLNCHQGGIAGFLISTNATQYFTSLTTTTAYLLKYFSVSNVDKKTVINTGSFESANKIQGHPEIDLTPTLPPWVALKKLYDLTAERKTANQCDPSRLKD
jgi:hypothetical protein